MNYKIMILLKFVVITAIMTSSSLMASPYNLNSKSEEEEEELCSTVSIPVSHKFVFREKGNSLLGLLEEEVDTVTLSHIPQGQFSLLPEEVNLHILRYLDIVSLVNIQQTSRIMTNVGRDNTLW